VTGSCFQIENPGGGHTLLDCGLFQGGRQTELRNFNTKLYGPDTARAMVVTHAHMDHSGLIPRLVKAGYRGPVFATDATCDLLSILWQDAAFIQEQESQWKTRKNKRQGGAKVEPLYDRAAATMAAKLLRPLPLGRDCEIAPGLAARFFNAGHILGAASVLVTADEPGGPGTVLFSGDLGRRGQILLKDPEIPPKADVVFMETTYGNRLHKDLVASSAELVEVVNLAHREGGKVLIPSFAVERTQELMLLLARAWHEGRIPRDMPIIMDSPLAIAASEIYLRHPELYDSETNEQIARGFSPLEISTFKVTRRAEESQKINDIQGPAVILAGSGMANAGRILHHLKHNLWRPNCHVVFAGFQAQGTTGRRLVEGARVVKIFREPVSVEAKIHTIGGFSGHADQKELLDWLAPQVHQNLTVVLVHGEETGTLAFQDKLGDIYPDLNTLVPEWLQTVETPGQAAPARLGPEKVEPGYASDDKTVEQRSIRARLDRLLDQLAARQAPLPPERLAALEGLLNQAEEIAMAPWGTGPGTAPPVGRHGAPAAPPAAPPAAVTPAAFAASSAPAPAAPTAPRTAAASSEAPGGGFATSRGTLSHLGAAGAARMVDVSDKLTTRREAVAKGRISLGAAAARAVAEQTLKKGDALGVARVAGIMAAKNTSGTIPLCHPLFIAGCDVDLELDEKRLELTATCRVSTDSRTGVEMEALNGVSTALLTVYDMTKSLGKEMVIGPVWLVEKTGGKSGDFRRPEDPGPSRG
jgi:metallo-beta-lactamase family protein